jgi:hypothetical protein
MALALVVPRSAAASGPVAIVANLGGALTVRDTSGASHDVSGAQALRSGETVMTGINGLASVAAAGALRARLGAGTTVQYASSTSGTTLRLSAGAMCVAADAPSLAVTTGGATLTVSSVPAVFDIAADSSGADVALYIGSITTKGPNGSTTTVDAPAALRLAGKNAPTHLDFQATTQEFTALPCPDRTDAQRVANASASPVPSPDVTAAPSSGGGGGGIIGLLAGIAGLAALAGHGGGGGGGGSSGGGGPPPTPPPGVLNTNPTSLDFASQSAAPQPFTASESNYTGAISAVISGNPGVATVSGSGNGPGPVTFTVTPVAPGTTTITVTDARGGSVAVQVAVSGPFQVNPQSLSFDSPTAGQKPITVNEPDYSGPFSAMSNNTTVATVSGSGNGPGPVTFMVMPHGAGNTNIVVSDNLGHTTNVSVSVAGVLSANPTSLTFNVGAPAQNVGVSEANYTGAISGKSNDTSIATVTGSGNGPGPVQFSVTPVGSGATSVTFSDVHGNTVNVSVTVQTPGALQVLPTSIGPIGVNAAGQTVTANEANYSGAISAVSSDPTIATVSGGGNGPGPVTFTVTPTGNKHGDVTVTVSDTIGNSVPVSVRIAGPISPSVNSLSFNGTTTPQMFTATDPNNTPNGTLSAHSSNTDVATVTGSGGAPGPVTFTVTPVGQGSANITVTDNIGQSAVVSVSVSTGGLVLNPTSLALYFNGSSGTPKQFTATQANFGGTISASTGNAGIATVSPASGPGPGPVTFTVTPAGAGDTNITVTGNGSVMLPVTVTGPLTTTKQSLTFGGTTTPQTFVANDPNFSGTITASSDATGVATVNPTGSGPSATFTVTPVSKGNATITVTDGVGGTAAVSITVQTGALGIVPTSLTFAGTSAPTQTATASENNYVGNITPSNCAIASFSPPVGHGPIQPFVVGPIAVGICHANIVTSDQQVTLTITVFGGLMVSPSSLTYSDVNALQTVNVSENTYTGNFSVANNTCSGIASVGTPSGPGPTATIAVTSSVSASGGTCSFDVDDDHGGSQAVSVTVGPFGVVNPSPASVALSVTSPTTGNVNVSESNYGGPFTATSADCSGIATFSGGPTAFTVTAVAPGSCTITMHDDHGQTAPVAVSVAGALMVSPTSHTFNDIGLTTPIAITEQNYTGAFNVTNSADCAGIATFSALTGSGPSFTLGVTSAGAGTCTFDVTDAFSASTLVTITVGPFGTVTPAPNPLPLNTSNNTSQSVAVSETGYSGQFTAGSTDCSGIATFPAGPATSFLVSAVAAGTCHIQFTDDHGGSGTETVVVDGTLTLSPNPLGFSDVNVTTPLAISETNYTGTFATGNSTCSGIATIGAPAGPGPSTTLNVTSLATGSCTFVVQDTDGQSVTETVNVGPFGAVVPSTAQLNLNTGGPTTGTFTISETGYNGTFTATLGPTCSSVASVSPGSGNSSVTFTVTALGVGTCGVHLADDHGQTALVTVEVASGGMSVSPASLTFPTTTSPTQNFTASDLLGINFVVNNPDPTDLGVTVTSGIGSASIAVTPTNANPSFSGTIALTVTDDIPGSSAVVEVGIAVASPLSKHHRVPPGGGKRVPPPRHGPRHGPPHPGSPRPIAPHPLPPRTTLHPLAVMSPAPTRSPSPGMPRAVLPPRSAAPPLQPAQPFDIALAFATLDRPGAQLVIQTRGTPDGALAAEVSDQTICTVQIMPGAGAVRSIVIVAKAAGIALVRVTDARGEFRTIAVRVLAPSAARGVPHTPGGPN